MFSKILCFLVMVFILISCGGDDEASETGTVSALKVEKGLVAYDSADFSLGIPAAWERIDNTAELLPKPNNGDIVLAATSSEFNNGFANNILILSQPLNKTTSSKDFSILNHIGVEKEYSEYVKLDVTDIEFLSGDNSRLYTFEARYNRDNPKLKFIQTAVVCRGNIGYFMTIAIPVNIKDTSKYNDILKTFSCK